ncbi:coproporphyrinogen III oxidase [Shewanella atlantica]|uniref:Coproporphyrinogen III oxidase n=1 Tax=Shewanella atlantica TaxID=271099 RepID=A0A431VW98_9GAMM|nr:coproporphyrinogen III oxidase [Shewanella atlantica]RTR27476.1 coproporphyrinogen III oxidase [Shewanella atlantica]
MLMSMPYIQTLVRWQYAYTPEANSAEALLYTDFLKPRDWLGLDK